jgi:uncharacterized protein
MSEKANSAELRHRSSRTDAGWRASRALLVAAFVLAAAARGQELPADPGFVWDPADSFQDETRREIAAAALKASEACGQRPIVVVSRPRTTEAPEEFMSQVEAAWPDRTILFVLRSDFKVRLRPGPSASPMLPPAAVSGFEERIHRRLYDSDFDRSIVNVLADLGGTLAGRPPAPWVEWKHPLFALGGGQDAQPVPLVAGIAAGSVAGFAVIFFLWALWRNPKRVLSEIAVGGAQIVIGGLVDAALGGGGGGGGGGNSFGGGGGSSGGGGANGSW